MKQIAGIIVFASACLFIPACTPTYRSIQPDRLTYEEGIYSSPDSTIRVFINYHVLVGRRSKIFSRMENRNNVNMVGIKVNNLSGRKLNMAEDFVFMTGKNDTIQPLPLETAIKALTVPITKGKPVDDWGVEGAGNAWEAVKASVILGRAISGTKKAISDLRLATDLEYNYLESITILPNSTEEGFLVLPVKRATPVKVKLKGQ